MGASLRIALFVTCIAVLGACSRERQDWQSAQTADTIEAYGAFVAKHGDSVLATQARERIRQLGEERDWQNAATLDTLDAYQRYLLQHPDSKWSGEARIRIENFALSGAPASQPGASQAPLAQSPVAPPATVGPGPASAAPVSPPPVAPAKSAAIPVAAPAPAAHAATQEMRYGVQLGAFSTDARATSEWQRIARAHPDTLAGLSPSVTVVRSGAGTLHRLRAATRSEAQARDICTALRARGQACLVVLPVGK